MLLAVNEVGKHVLSNTKHHACLAKKLKYAIPAIKETCKLPTVATRWSASVIKVSE